MSQPTAAGSHKRPAASPANGEGAQPAAQRPRLDDGQGGERREASDAAATAAAAAPAVSPSSPMSPAQRCAADTLASAFAFLPFKDLPRVLRVCRDWLAAAAKEKPRDCTINRIHRLKALLASRSPLRRHVSVANVRRIEGLSLGWLRQLPALPFLSGLEVTLVPAELLSLLAQDRASALSQLRAAFPPRLQRLSLCMHQLHGTALYQLQLDALPSQSGLTALTLETMAFGGPDEFASTSLDPLLQLPRLTSLAFDLDSSSGLSIAQLGVVKQIASLRQLKLLEAEWSVEQLAALCRPPHRLQQLEEFGMGHTAVDAAHMAELMHLPALTQFEPNQLLPDAYPFLPRLTLMRQLQLNLEQYAHPTISQEQQAEMDAALRACALLVQLTVWDGVCTEAVGTRLLHSLPHLRQLHVQSASLPSLRFLRHAPQLEELHLYFCTEVRPAHLALLGQLAPRLTHLVLIDCDQLRLDELEVQSLTPPSRLLPSLTSFKFRPDG